VVVLSIERWEDGIGANAALKADVNELTVIKSRDNRECLDFNASRHRVADHTHPWLWIYSTRSACILARVALTREKGWQVASLSDDTSGSVRRRTA
jgi:hypothetical protein